MARPPKAKAPSRSLPNPYTQLGEQLDAELRGYMSQLTASVAAAEVAALVLTATGPDDLRRDDGTGWRPNDAKIEARRRLASIVEADRAELLRVGETMMARVVEYEARGHKLGDDDVQLVVDVRTHLEQKAQALASMLAAYAAEPGCDDCDDDDDGLGVGHEIEAEADGGGQP